MRGCVCVIACVLAGCGDEGPSTGGRVQGDWSYAVSLSFNGVTCTESGTVLHMTQTGTVLGGTYDGGRWICAGSGGTDTSFIGPGTIDDGRQTGDSIWFNLDSGDWYSIGVIAAGDGSMGGVVNATFPGTAVVVAGSWSSTRP